MASPELLSASSHVILSPFCTNSLEERTGTLGSSELGELVGEAEEDRSI